MFYFVSLYLKGPAMKYRSMIIFLFSFFYSLIILEI